MHARDLGFQKIPQKGQNCMFAEKLRNIIRLTNLSLATPVRSMKHLLNQLPLTTLTCIAVAACSSTSSDPILILEQTATCSDQVLLHIDGMVVTQDGQGHGPDQGSEEWHSAVEFKLNVTSKPDLPARNSNEWCAYIAVLINQETDTH